MRAALSAFLTSASDWAWLRSGSTRARTSPLFTESPSRCRMLMTFPDTADLTSTLTSGCTLPTSVILTWMSATSALPTFAGSFGSFGVPPFAFIATKAMTTTSASPIAEKIASFFFRFDAMPAPRSALVAAYNGRGGAKVSARHTARFRGGLEQIADFARGARVEDEVVAGDRIDGHDDGALRILQLIVGRVPRAQIARPRRVRRKVHDRLRMRNAGAEVRGHRRALVAMPRRDRHAGGRTEEDDDPAAQRLRAFAARDGEVIVGVARGGGDSGGKAGAAAGKEVVHEFFSVGFARQLRPLRALALRHEVALRRLRPGVEPAEIGRGEQQRERDCRDGLHSFAACSRSNCSCGYEPALTFSCASWMRPFSSITYAMRFAYWSAGLVAAP